MVLTTGTLSYRKLNADAETTQPLAVAETSDTTTPAQTTEPTQTHEIKGFQAAAIEKEEHNKGLLLAVIDDLRQHRTKIVRQKRSQIFRQIA